MSTANTRAPVPGKRVAIDVPRLCAEVWQLRWSPPGGQCRSVGMPRPAEREARCAAAASLHRFIPPELCDHRIRAGLSGNCPRPSAVGDHAAAPLSLAWIVGLVTAATMVLPFALEGSLNGEVCAMVRSMHRQPALQRAVPDGRRRRAILASALVGDQLVVSHHNRAGQPIM
jgi:hypothetical protein